MSNFYDDDFIFYDDSSEEPQNENMVDISEASADNAAEVYSYGDSDKKHGARHKEGLGKKKKIVVACCAVGVVVIGAVAAGVCLMTMGTPGGGSPLEAFEFKYSEDAMVSGISIGGKTYSQALELLSSRQDEFITPVSVTVEANGEKYQLTQEDFEYTFDTEDVLASIKKAEESKTDDSDVTYKVTAVCSKDSIEAQVEKIKKEADIEPVNARVSKFTPYDKNRFVYEDAKVGYIIDGDDLAYKLANAVTGESSFVQIKAVVKEEQAEISKDMVQKNIVELASYTTVSTNTANATSNMGLALSACNGSVIEPGGVWSFNECTGDSNLESNGYKSASVISAGKLVPGIGGGICQASSTIYNAAIRSNLDIEERSPHLWASFYVPTGLDATIDYPNLDLKLSNPTDYQIFLECKLDGTTLKVTFWGYHDPSYDEIKVENEIGSVSGGEYSTRAWRVYYKDGKEVDREELPSSKYDSKNGMGGGSASNDPNLNRSTSGTESTKPTQAIQPTTKPTQATQPTTKPAPATEAPKPTTQPKTEAPKPATEPQTEAPTEPKTEPSAQTPTETEPEPQPQEPAEPEE